MADRQMVSFCVPEIPDIEKPRSIKDAGGDVAGALQDGFMRLLRRVANELPGRVAVTFRFLYAPLSVVHRVQARLNLSVHLAGSPAATARLANHIERGLLSSFYTFKRDQPRPVPWDRLTALCHLVRRARLLPSLHKPEVNPFALPFYYAVDPLEANTGCDYSKLDQVLSSLDEHACIDIAMEPDLVRDELSTNTHYIQRLRDMNWNTGGAAEGLILPVVPVEGSPDMPRVGIEPRESRMRDPVAEDVFQIHKKLNEDLVLPHVRFNIRVMAETRDTAKELAHALGNEAFDGGVFDVLSFSPQDTCFEETLSCAQNGLVAAVPSRCLYNEDHPRLYDGLSGLPQLATPERLGGVFRLPYGGSCRPLRCIRRDTDPPLEIPEQFIVFGYDEEVGYHLPDGTYCGELRGMPLSDTNTHGILVGATRTRKTTTAASLIPQFWKYRVPSLIIAPIKHDFRFLKILADHPDTAARSLADVLEIYSVGDNRLSPFRYNPLEIPAGITRDEHSANLLTCFQASMPVFGPLIALISEAIEDVYEAFEGSYRWPVVADLVEAAERVMNRAGYKGDVDAVLRAAFTVRMRSLCRNAIGTVLSSCISVPSLEHILSTPTLIELEGLPSENASLLTLFVLTGMREHVKTRRTTGTVMHEFFLDEAHGIAGNTEPATPSEDFPSAASHSAEFFERLSAEIAGYGEGVWVMEQLLTKLASGVTKNARNKMIFNVPDAEEKDGAGDSALLGPVEKEEITRQRAGEAFLYTVGSFRACSVKAASLFDNYPWKPPPTDEELMEIIEHDGWYVDGANTRLIAEMDVLLGRMKQVGDKVREFKGDLAHLEERLKKLPSQPSNMLRKAARQLRADAETLRGNLASVCREFRMTGYRGFLEERVPRNVDPDVRAQRDRLIALYESDIAAPARACEHAIQVIIDCCERTFLRRA